MTTASRTTVREVFMEETRAAATVATMIRRDTETNEWIGSKMVIMAANRIAHLGVRTAIEIRIAVKIMVRLQASAAALQTGSKAATGLHAAVMVETNDIAMSLLARTVTIANARSRKSRAAVRATGSFVDRRVILRNVVLPSGAAATHLILHLHNADVIRRLHLFR